MVSYASPCRLLLHGNNVKAATAQTHDHSHRYYSKTNHTQMLPMRYSDGPLCPPKKEAIDDARDLQQPPPGEAHTKGVFEGCKHWAAATREHQSIRTPLAPTTM
jgi:hypothetical protein